ncbi:DUF4336 domain-containing protein [Sphingomonas sp. 67-36]|nr:DUF4336 domain-containing protein [Sphingomonas sp. 67-36]OJV28208.1 MAG: hypothetical protein BGO24_07700 [Sphingomonas sp. 67-36]
MSASLYDPINCYKPVAENIGIVDGPFEYFTVAGIRMPMPFTTRMTVVRIANGDLVLHSPIAFDERLAAELRKMGTVRHLISPNQWHYAHIGEWQVAFPDALAWASPGVRRRAHARKIVVRFDRDLQPAPPDEWRTEIDQTLIPSGIFSEFVFFHEMSRTLILTDTIMNMDLHKLDEPWRSATRLAGMYHPHGQLFFGVRISLLFRYARAKAAFQKIRSWQPQRILLSHGRCFEAKGEEVTQRVFGRE